jgi:hypothetical protein
MFYQIISFHAKLNDTSTFYKDCAKSFEISCSDLSLGVYVEELEGHKNYYKNCRMKPAFIEKCLGYFNKPVLWLDIDSSITGAPDLTSVENSSFAAVPQTKGSLYPIFSHALYFNNTKESKELLNIWKKECDNSELTTAGDHSILCRVLEEQNFKYSYINTPHVKLKQSKQHRIK